MYSFFDQGNAVKPNFWRALKTEEVKLTLKPTARGAFSLKQTVLYLDENGKYKSHEPKPVTIVVKELGIKGWLKGKR